jgi:hypothetical protein
MVDVLSWGARGESGDVRSTMAQALAGKPPVAPAGKAEPESPQRLKDTKRVGRV